VIVDLAAERGGNCEITVADQEVRHAAVLVLGPTDLASGSAGTASQMLSTNVVNLLTHLAVDGRLSLDRDDEIVGPMLVASGGEVTNDQVRKALDSTPRSV
jgi:NAD(P) transhydrogenase subunit alpha